VLICLEAITYFNKGMRRLNKIATCVAVALAIASTHQTAFALDLVYSNATTDLGVNFNPGNNSEVGNEVVLAGTSRPC